MSPLRPLFPGTHLTLLTLLALLAAPGGARDSAAVAARSSLPESKGVVGGARAVAAPCASRGGDACSCGRDQPMPTIAATTAISLDGVVDKSMRNEYDHWVYLYSLYGEEITIFCSSNNASSLTIRDDDNHLQAERLNSTTIQVTLTKPDVRRYRYHCTDSITSCIDALQVNVRPAMSVTAPHVRRTRDGYNEYTIYFVPRGESYNIYCSGHQTSELTVTDTYGHVMQTNSVNSTTLMATVSDHTEGVRENDCRSSSSRTGENIRVRVDYYPEARDFRCILNRLSNLECWWQSTTTQNFFILFLIIDDRRSTFVCHDRSHALTAGCASVWDADNWQSHRNDFFISFQLETCNGIFCSNQTFLINMKSIAKLDPVDDLKRINTSPQGATVAWNDFMFDDCTYKDYTYKVEYRLLGTDWYSVNASLIHYTYSSYDNNVTYELQLALPCPDAHYELRVYIRFKEATLDMYWSEPATLYFFTPPSTGGEVNPACAADFREVTEKPTPSATVVLYRVRQLVSNVRKEKQALRKYIRGLKNKLADIKALMTRKSTTS